MTPFFQLPLDFLEPVPTGPLELLEGSVHFVAMLHVSTQNFEEQPVSPKAVQLRLTLNNNLFCPKPSSHLRGERHAHLASHLCGEPPMWPATYAASHAHGWPPTWPARQASSLGPMANACRTCAHKASTHECWSFWEGPQYTLRTCYTYQPPFGFPPPSPLFRHNH